MSDEPALLGSVRAGRRTLAEVGPTYARSDGDFARVSLPHRDCDVLRDLLVEDRARVVIEIGLAYGSSALAIAEALVLVGAETGAISSTVCSSTSRSCTSSFGPAD